MPRAGEHLANATARCPNCSVLHVHPGPKVHVEHPPSLHCIKCGTILVYFEDLTSGTWGYGGIVE